MLRIRLARHGSRKRPCYRLVVADARAPRDGRFVERLGHYHPLLPHDHEDRIRINHERASYWLGVGAQPTGRVARFLVSAGLMEPRPVPEQTRKNQMKSKNRQRAAEAQAAASESA